MAPDPPVPARLPTVTTRLFVYGTLMPGHLRWALLAPFAISEVPVDVAGQLFDTGRGWPAARFTNPIDVPALADGRPSPDQVIPGWIVEVDPHAIEGLLVELDEVEGVGADPHGPDGPAGAYRRVQVRAADGGPAAWGYEAASIDERWAVLAAWTATDER